MLILKKIFRLLHYKIRGGVLHGQLLGVKIGNDCRVFINDWGSEPYLIELGNNVTITGGVKLLTHDGSTCLLKKLKSRYYIYGRIIIGNNVFVGTNTIIMPGVSIGDNVVIGAGSVVTKDLIKPGVYVGSPAKFIKPFNEFKNKIEQVATINPENSSTLTDKQRVLAHLVQKDSKQ
jgi:acetyltransferase-like isoleucine patch superfamily enzyme